MDRYLYLDGKRPVALGELRFDTYGWLVETLYDLGAAARLAETLDKLPDRSDPVAIPVRRLPPPYVLGAIGDFLAGKSGFRTDRAAYEEHYPKRVMDPPYGAAAFADATHLLSRMLPRYLFEEFVLPQGVHDALAEVNEQIAAYHGLLRTHGAYFQVPREERARIDAALDRVFVRLDEDLSAIEALEIRFGPAQQKLLGLDPRCETLFLPNRGVRLHPTCAESNPAQVALQLKIPARASVNQMKLPLRAVVHSLDIIGAESMISDTMQAFMDLVDEAARAQWGTSGTIYGRLYTDLRAGLRTNIELYAHELRFLLQFSLTTDAAYPLAYSDLRLLLSFARQPSVLLALRGPSEAASLLYAVGKRFLRSEMDVGSTGEELFAAADSVWSGAMARAEGAVNRARPFAIALGDPSVLRSLDLVARFAVSVLSQHSIVADRANTEGLRSET